MGYLFTSESVSEGHPDKIADQISDSILDNFLAYDSRSKVACESMVTTGQVVVVGEVSSKTYVDVQKVVRETIEKIGYNDSKYGFDFNSCGVISAIHEQSPDISMGIDRIKKEDQGAGDQGIMFGYAVDETEDYMPMPIYLSHLLLRELTSLRKSGEIEYLRPDSKSQVTMEYGYDNKPNRIDTIVISTQHDDFIKDDKKMLSKIAEDIVNILIPRVKEKLGSKIVNMFRDDIKYFINPTGRFVIGGPDGDAGLTGRKIIVDTYGGKGAHGGGAFSGKDSSKVDRSASYAARHIAKNLVASGVSSEVLVQLSYAIGVSEPISIYVNTYGKSNLKISDFEIAKKINNIFDLRPSAIENSLKLREPIYFETSKYGHMGRKREFINKNFESSYFGKVEKRVELFTWEALDYVDKIRKEFNI